MYSGFDVQLVPWPPNIMKAQQNCLQHFHSFDYETQPRLEEPDQPFERDALKRLLQKITKIWIFRLLSAVEAEGKVDFLMNYLSQGVCHDELDDNPACRRPFLLPSCLLHGWQADSPR